MKPRLYGLGFFVPMLSLGKLLFIAMLLKGEVTEIHNDCRAA